VHVLFLLWTLEYNTVHVLRIIFSFFNVTRYYNFICKTPHYDAKRQKFSTFLQSGIDKRALGSLVTKDRKRYID
jgi:hypothetical protein